MQAIVLDRQQSSWDPSTAQFGALPTIYDFPVWNWDAHASTDAKKQSKQNAS